MLDAGGNLVSFRREDGCGVLRFDIALGKAWGALGMGMATRQIRDRLANRPTFQGALAAASGGRFIPTPGGVLILNAQHIAIGAVGISGDASDKDEFCAIEAWPSSPPACCLSPPKRRPTGTAQPSDPPTIPSGDPTMFFKALALTLTLSLTALQSNAQTFPLATVKLVVPLTAGSGADTAARALAQSLSKLWKQPVVVDNKPGAGGLIGTGAVVTAEPNGLTLLLQSAGYAANPAVYKKLPYDASNALIDVGLIGSTQYGRR